MSRKSILAVIHGFGNLLASYSDICRALGIDPEDNALAVAQEVAAMFMAGIDFPWWRIIATDGTIVCPYADIQAEMIQREFHNSTSICNGKVLFITKLAALDFASNKFNLA